MATSSQAQGLSKYVTLVSSDDFEFVVLREAACISGAIKRMLDPASENNFISTVTLHVREEMLTPLSCRQVQGVHRWAVQV
jgi:hypothetical protein